MILTREELKRIGGEFAVKKCEHKDITFYVREVNVKQYDHLQQMGAAFLNSGGSGPSFRAKAVCYFLCDENGNRLFNDNQLTEIENLNGAVIDKIFTAGWGFNQLGEDVEARAMEEAEKN